MDRPLFQRISARLRTVLGQLTEQDVANVAWAFAMLHDCDGRQDEQEGEGSVAVLETCASLAKKGCTEEDASWEPTHLCNVLWSPAVVGKYDGDLFQGCIRSVQ